MRPSPPISPRWPQLRSAPHRTDKKPEGYANRLVALGGAGQRVAVEFLKFFLGCILLVTAVKMMARHREYRRRRPKEDTDEAERAQSDQRQGY
jgi:hypothetical protein